VYGVWNQHRRCCGNITIPLVFCATTPKYLYKDEFGYAWQVLLFKQNYFNPVRDLRLRLVAFPGVVEIAHPQPLEIEATSGKLLSASDAYAITAPAPNVGEYNLTDVLPKLPKIWVKAPSFYDGSIFYHIVLSAIFRDKICR
jgi:Protein of unknown function (DUF3122)